VVGVNVPVTDLDDFVPTSLALLEAADADGLGALYAEDAVLTSSGGPAGTSWAVGRAAIVANLAAALQTYRVDHETAPTTPYERRGDHLAARLGTFVSTVSPRSGGPGATLTVEAFEVLALSPSAGWQYLADQSRVVSITTHPPRP
jgi:hypothetical protein